jgi:cystathionine beta-lyase family protein involved in aluminum resistance
LAFACRAKTQTPKTSSGVFAAVLGAEAAVVRSQFFSGTHAIACALFGVLRPGDTLLAVSGPPYDTLDEVIGSRRPSEGNGGAYGVKVAYDADGSAVEAAGSESDFAFGALPLDGSLKEWGIHYQEVNLTADGYFDLGAIDAALDSNPTVRLIHVQRSCGYQWRPSIPIAEIGKLCAHVKTRNAAQRAAAAASPAGGDADATSFKPLVVFVDNCYGELVEDVEPCAVGADLCAGSLIKNLGKP